MTLRCLGKNLLPSLVKILPHYSAFSPSPPNLYAEGPILWGVTWNTHATDSKMLQSTFSAGGQP